MIQIKNLNKSYNNLEVLKNISLSIKKGNICGLIGKSGAGKSTLLRCINGLEEFQSGEVIVDGTNISEFSKKDLRVFRKDIGMIFQHFSLIERKTVYDNIALPLKCWKYSKEEIDQKVKELVSLVGIEDKINVKAKNISGGQKQRVAIARALALDPNILLCDEATSALDPSTTNDILNLLKKINDELGITIVIVSHQMDVIQQICDTMAILQDGNIVERGNVDEIFLKQPLSLINIVGEDKINPPKHGSYIKVISNNNNQTFSSMANDIRKEFEVLSYKIEEFKNTSFETFVIKVDDLNIDTYINWLSNRNLTYEIISQTRKEMKVNA